MIPCDAGQGGVGSLADQKCGPVAAGGAVQLGIDDVPVPIHLHDVELVARVAGGLIRMDIVAAHAHAVAKGLHRPGVAGALGLVVDQSAPRGIGLVFRPIRCVATGLGQKFLCHLHLLIVAHILGDIALDKLLDYILHLIQLLLVQLRTIDAAGFVLAALKTYGVAQNRAGSPCDAHTGGLVLDAVQNGASLRPGDGGIGLEGACAVRAIDKALCVHPKHRQREFPVLEGRVIANIGDQFLHDEQVSALAIQLLTQGGVLRGHVRHLIPGGGFRPLGVGMTKFLNGNGIGSPDIGGGPVVSAIQFIRVFQMLLVDLILHHVFPVDLRDVD